MTVYVLIEDHGYDSMQVRGVLTNRQKAIDWMAIATFDRRLESFDLERITASPYA